MNTADETLQVIRRIADGLPGLRRLFYHLNYDYADALLPAALPRSFEADFAAPPRLIATACIGGFSVLWFPMRRFDVETERHICAYYCRFYPAALYLFSEENSSVWHFTCVPDEPQVSPLSFLVDVNRLTPNMEERVAALAVDEETADVVSLLEQAVEACAAASLGDSPVKQRIRQNQQWKSADTWWTAQFSKYPLLDARQEAHLAQRVADGDEEAFEALVNSNLRLVLKIARMYARPNMPLPDLIQEGHLGLLRAVSKYNVTLGYRFSTYAVWWIRRAVTRAVADQGRIIRLPVYITDDLNGIHKAVRDGERQTGRSPTIEALAAQTQMSQAKLEALLPLRHAVMSLEYLWQHVEHAASPIWPQASSEPETILMQEAFSAVIEQALNQLTPREKEALILRFGLRNDEPRTLEDVGTVLGITRERVRQIESSALAKLRKRSLRGQWRGFVSEKLMSAQADTKRKNKQTPQTTAAKAVVPLDPPAITTDLNSVFADGSAFGIMEYAAGEQEDAFTVETEDDASPTEADIDALLIELEPELTLRHPSSALRKARVHARNSQQPVFDFTDQT